MTGLRLPALALPLLILGSLAWVALLAFDHLENRASFLERMENRLLDLRYQIVGPVDAAPEIVIVAIDDATLDTGQTGPVGRARLAQLVHNIADSGARLIAVDILLADAGIVSERTALADALSRIPTVIAAAARFDPTGPPHVIWPHQAFRAVSEVGLVNLSTDDTGTPRYLPLFIEADGDPQPSLPLLAAVSLTGERARIDDRALTLGARNIPLDVGANMPLRLLGPTGTVPTISAMRVMDGPVPDKLAGKLVVLGFSAAAMGDRFTTPFDADTPGPEIIATAISQLIGPRTLRQDSQTRVWDVVHSVGLAVLCVILMLRAPLRPATWVVLGLTVLSFGAVTVFFANGLLFSAALPLAATLPPALLAGVLRLDRSRNQARKSARSLASLRRFQSPALARRIESDPEYLMTPQAEELVIFFVDLTGFTSLSQQLGPDGTSALLRSFHGVTTDAVEQRGGSVINYIGDGALAVFGLDSARPGQSHADAALQAALALENGLTEIRPSPEAPPLTSRIGLHIGPVILSRLGAENHEQVSVSGDTVNLASRLMEVAKAESAGIAATRAFTDHLTEGAPLTNTLHSQIAVRGRSGTVDVVLWPRLTDQAAA